MKTEDFYKETTTKHKAFCSCALCCDSLRRKLEKAEQDLHRMQDENLNLKGKK